MKRVRLRVEGRVQGVWFRQSTANEANRLGLAGWVRNMPDGSVEAVAEGEEGKLQALADWCASGPPLAKVTKVHKTEEEPEGFTPPFKVER